MLTVDEMLDVLKFEQALGGPMRDGCPSVRNADDPRLGIGSADDDGSALRAKQKQIEKARADLDSASAEAEKARLRLLLLTTDRTHVNGVRDPEHPCTSFVLGEPEPVATCETDGHYICDECVHRKTCSTGCGQRPSLCTCKWCEVCRVLGNECSCTKPWRGVP